MEQPRLLGFTQAELQRLFVYDRDTGLVTRRIARGHEPAGKVVGTRDGAGYLQVSVARRGILLHRLAFFIVTGTVPRYVDHKNRVKTDNQWCNLRECSQGQNLGNSGISRHNTSGYRGVSRHSQSGKWQAQIKIDRRQTYLALTDDPHSAALIYNQAASEHFGDFATFNVVPVEHIL